MNDGYDVIVIGLGAMGSSSAYHLARRGLRVLGLEQFTPAHDRGSSHGDTRIVRQAYFECPDYVPLLQRSYQLWDELSAEFGEELFVRCGSLMIGRPDSTVVMGTLASARRWDLAYDLLDQRAMKERYPQFALPDDHVAVFEANAGFARAEASVLANLELAMDAGADLWFDAEVESVALGPSGVHVEVGGEEWTAPHAVIATGAWAPKLANLDRLPYSVQRQTVHWFEPTAGPAGLADFDPDRFPVYVWQWPAGSRPSPASGATSHSEEGIEIYGFPHQPGGGGVKVGVYRDGTDTDPAEVDTTVTEADIERLRPLIERALPSLSGRWLSGIACMYAGVPDDDFVVGLHPGSSGRIVLAVGFSGHGFKFAPVVGEIAADLVTTGQTAHEVGFLSPARVW
jgi:sarcosine oxidase